MNQPGDLLPQLMKSTLIPIAELAQFHHHEPVLNLMEQLQLGCYRRPDDTFWWIGSASPLLHDHERWVYRISANLVRLRGSFEALLVDMMDTCQHSGGENLIDSMQELSSSLQTLAVRLGLDHPMTATQLATQLAVFANFSYINLDTAKRFNLQRLVWQPQLHDLLYHFDDYRVDHPENGDMPRELLLRMHGLGAYMDLQHEGIDLLS